MLYKDIEILLQTELFEEFKKIKPLFDKRRDSLDDNKNYKQEIKKFKKMFEEKRLFG